MTYHFQFGAFGPEGPSPFGGAGRGNRNWKIPVLKKPIGSPVARTLINLIVTAIVGLGWFYFALPALNPHAEEFYFFLLLLCGTYCLCAVITSGFQDTGLGGYLRFLGRQCRIPLIVVLLMIVVVALGSLSSWVVLRAGSYSALLPLSTRDFTADVEEISYDQIPMLDGASAALLGNRKLGELADMVSQFEILPTYDMDGSLYHPDQLSGPPRAGDFPCLRGHH